MGREHDVFVGFCCAFDFRKGVEGGHFTQFFGLGVHADDRSPARFSKSVKQSIILQHHVYGWDFFGVGIEDFVYAEALAPVAADNACCTSFFQCYSQGSVIVSRFADAFPPGFGSFFAFLLHFVHGSLGSKLFPIVIWSAGRLWHRHQNEFAFYVGQPLLEGCGVSNFSQYNGFCFDSFFGGRGEGQLRGFQ